MLSTPGFPAGSFVSARMNRQPSPAKHSSSRGSVLAGESLVQRDARDASSMDNLLGSDTHHQQAEGNNPPRSQSPSDNAHAASSETSIPSLFEGFTVGKEGDTSLLSDQGKLLINFLSDTRNKVSSATREKVLGIFFDVQSMFMSLRARLSYAEGVINELRSQLAECRGEGAAPHHSPCMPAMPRRSFVDAVRGPRVAPQDISAPTTSGVFPPESAQQRMGDATLPSDPNHVLYLTPLLPSVHPGPETISLLKSTFGNDPSGIGVKQVKLIPNRSGLTVISADRASIDNLEKAIEGNNQLKTAIKVARPPRRLPQFKISGVDPSVVPGILRTNINARNGLDIREEDFKHRTYFKDRTGNNVHIVEVSPPVYHLLKTKDRLLIGWTSCPIKENFYVAACSRCCTYGHVASRCSSESVCCPYCSEDHSAADCTLSDRERVVCRECRVAGRRSDHTFNAPCCYTVASKVARMRQKTIYDPAQTSTSSTTTPT